jgi:cytochrome P460
VKQLTRIALWLLLAGCGQDGGDAVPLFPANYVSSYVQVRECRASADHDLSRVRVLADPRAAPTYVSRDGDFAEGSLVLKAEYDFADVDCTGEIQRWTAMRREAPGSSADTLDWTFQKVDAERKVLSENDSRCVGCHTGCGKPPDGYLGTCSAPGSLGAGTLR